MRERTLVAAVVGAGLVLGACSSSSAGSPTTTTVPPTTTTDPPTTTSTTSTTTSTTSTTTSTTSTTTSTTSTTTSTTVPTTTTVPPSTAPPSTESTTTTVAPAPVCTYTIQIGDTLDNIVVAINDPALTLDALVAENGIADPNAISAGTVLDVCAGNGIDDTTGAPRVAPSTAPLPTEPPTTEATPPPETAPPDPSLPSGVAAQQDKLNALFANLGMPALTVDGQSGRFTRQQLCAVRVALSLPVNRLDMAPGGPEEQALMSAPSLPIPATAPVDAGRWALIDQTCQVMFVGEGGQLAFVFQTSTGKPQYLTRNQTASRVFRYDPAVANGGWHNSTQFPVAEDNPLNGNMYKPIYFDRGQAIHGANTVPTSAASHGCARLHIGEQDTLVAWLGLADVQAPISNAQDRLAFTVTVQGRY